MKARSAQNDWQFARPGGPVILVTTVGSASGARAAAAALACAASEPDRAALLIDLSGARAPRPSLISTAGARSLEERLKSHLPGVPVASRGQICHLSLPSEPAGIERIAAAIPLVRESAAVIHLPPSLARPALWETRIQPTAVLLRADMADARALIALSVRDLMADGLRVAVLKHPLGWLSARAALLGAMPPGVEPLSVRMSSRLLGTDDNKFRHCYPERDGSEDDQTESSPPAPSVRSAR